MKDLKNNKGITIMSLIITIVVLIILAVVTIQSVERYLITAAEDVTEEYNEKREGLEEYKENLNASLGEEYNEVVSISNAQGKILSLANNTNVQDEYGNIIVVPAGFMITADANNVTEGIVISDGTNEFVWIPVGNIIKSDDSVVNIELCRYKFADGTSDLGENSAVLSKGTQIKIGENTISNGTDTFAELTKSNYGNSTSINLEDFKNSVEKNGGYYIARYEARTSIRRTEKTDDNGLTPVTYNKEDYVYVFVSQPQASKLSKEMYGEDKPFTSDLMNSYAWDTAIVFAQMFDDRTDTTIPYSYKGRTQTEFLEKGTDVDIICNIYDMSENVWEWTTETYNKTGSPCSFRGGYFVSDAYYTSSRDGVSLEFANIRYSFRTIIYL